MELIVTGIIIALISYPGYLLGAKITWWILVGVIALWFFQFQERKMK